MARCHWITSCFQLAILARSLFTMSIQRRGVLEEDVSDSLDLAGPLRLPSTSPHDDTSPPVEAKRFVSLAEDFSTAEKLPRFTMAQILHYCVWRTAVDGLPNADSKSISESAMNLSQGGHIQKIMVNITDDSLEFKGACRAEMKKKVQYNIAFIISCATSAITHAVCGCPAGKGPQATCKHIGAFCFTLEEFCRTGKLRDFVTCTDQLQVWHQPKPAKPHMVAVAELVSRRKEIKTPPAISPPPVRQTRHFGTLGQPISGKEMHMQSNSYAATCCRQGLTVGCCRYFL